jgi:hypothetical protein
MPRKTLPSLDSRFRGNDEEGRIEENHLEVGGSAGEGCEALLARKVVPRLDVADRAGFRAHDDRMRRGAAGKAAHAAQHRAIGDPGRRKHDVARGEVEQFVLTIEVGDSKAMGAAALVVIAEQQPSLHLPADAAQRRRGEHAFVIVDVEAFTARSSTSI